jgi:hypothetical protein
MVRWWVAGVFAGCVAGCSTIIEFEDDASGSTTQVHTTEGPRPPGSSSSHDPTPPGGSTEPATTSAPPDDCGFLDCQTDLPPMGMLCDLWDDTCPKGMKCNPVQSQGSTTWDSHRCVPLAERPDEVGESCTVLGEPGSGIDTCGRGAMCWNLREGRGRCTPHCRGSYSAPRCDDRSRACRIDGDGLVPLCYQRCDPLQPDSCDPTHERCGYDSYVDTFICHHGWGEDSTPPLSSCTYAAECTQGSECGQNSGLCDDNATNCCVPLCDQTAPDCPVGASCAPYFVGESVPRGHKNVGFCTF